MEKRSLLGNTLLILTALIWGTAFVFQRQGMDHIEPVTFNAARNVLAAFLIGSLTIFLDRRRIKAGEAGPVEEAVRRKNTVTGGLCCGILLSLSSVVQQIGLVYTAAGKAGFITALYMILVPIFNYLIFGKRSGPVIWIAAAGGTLGLYLLCVSDGFSLTYGDSLVCICAVLFAFHILCADHFVDKGDPVGISAIQFAVAAVTCSIAALIFEHPTWDKIASAAVPILFCGVLSSSVGYTLQIVAQKMTDPSVASLLLSLESVFAVIAGALLLGERMSLREIAGCMIMFAAIILVQLPSVNKGEREG